MLKIRYRDLAAGAVVLLVPTYATIYADGVRQWPAVIRHGLFALWVVAAAVIVIDQVARNQRADRSIDAFDQLTVEKEQRLQYLADQARDSLLRALLTPHLWFPRKWDWTVYVFDADTELLTPIWPGEVDLQRTAANSFAPSKGATGQAWSDEETIVRIGAEVHDGSHGLTPLQQAHFRNRHSVVATPIWADDEKIGVLAGTCDDEDHAFESEQQRSHIRQTATVLGTLLSALRPRANRELLP